MIQLTERMKSELLQGFARVVGQTVTESTKLDELATKLDSMSRSEMIFVIEDVTNVDVWGLNLKEFLTIEDLFGEIERRGQ